MEKKKITEGKIQVNRRQERIRKVQGLGTKGLHTKNMKSELIARISRQLVVEGLQQTTCRIE